MDIAAHRRAIQYARTRRREMRNIIDPFHVSDALFIGSYRLTKPLVRLLVRELMPFLHGDENPVAVPNIIKVLSVLHFYATGSYQASVANSWLNCLGRSTVGHFIEEVTNALNEPAVFRRWVKFPVTREARQRIQERHQRKFQIPGVVGFVDGTEVPIYTPPQNINPQGFWTYKNQYALNCQMACDSNLIILSVNANYPGATGDAFVWRQSGLRRRMRDAFEEDQSSWLLGDSAYPREPWLVPPILHAAEGSPEAYFTECHCKARNCIERCYGCLKCRFRCLLRERVLHYHPAKAGRIVKACCVLHNMCRMARVPEEDIEPVEGEEDPLPWVNNEAEALLEAEDDNDPALRFADRGLEQVGEEVRQRLVDFLHIQRVNRMNE